MLFRSGQLDAIANVPGKFTYSPAAGTKLKVGNGQTLRVTFIPTDATDYTTATGTAKINVVRAILPIPSLFRRTSKKVDIAKKKMDIAKKKVNIANITEKKGHTTAKKGHTTEKKGHS